MAVQGAQLCEIWNRLGFKLQNYVIVNFVFSSYVYRVAFRDTPFPQKVFILNLSCKNDNFDSLLTITLTEHMFNMTT